MRLFAHADFDQAIIRAAEHFKDRNLRPSVIEKDYYVTEALRAIALTGGDRIIFKGGTSLSKGWNLIERFSEDIDVFLDRERPTRLGAKAVNTQLKKLRDAVLASVPLEFLKGESKTRGGSARDDRFRYEQRFGGPGEVPGKLLLESGIASGREPTEICSIESFLAQYLREAGVSLGTEDEQPFKMRLLHFRRTFVEKMFAIHKKVELFKRDRTPVGAHARHYYDLFQLSSRDEVLAMLRNDEYAQIKADYDRVSREHYPDQYFCPEEMSFTRSDALFPSDELSSVLGSQYEAQCQQLCYGPFPSWNEVRSRFDNLRSVL